MGFAFDDFAGGNLPRRHLQMGFGDTELGAKYRFITADDDDWWPQVATFPAVELPSGNAGRGLGAGQTQAFLPVWAQKNFGKWTTDGGGGYWINPGPGNKDYWFAGWLIQRQITEDFALGVEVFHQTAAMAGRKASSGFNAGGIYDWTEHDHLLFSAGQGGLQYAVNGAAAQNPFTYYLGFQWTF